jgi:hypothetical protein
MASPEHFNVLRETGEFLGEHGWKILIAWIALGAAVASPIGKALKKRRLEDSRPLVGRED